jgi:diacylglycerol kinase family enzyme
MTECVIFNPAAGRGRARRLVGRLRRLRGSAVDLRPTKGPGHAAELSARAVEAGHTTVLAAGGDGTVHEVANGLIGRPDVVFGVWPIGSANDYAYALGVSGDWPLEPRRRERLAAAPVDVGRVNVGGRVTHFVNGFGLGFNGAVTHESRRIRGLRGMALYGLAFVRAVARHFHSPPLVIGLDGKERELRTLAFSVNIGQREGGFRVTPKARLDDGLFDYVHAGPLTRWQALTMLPRLATGTLPDDHRLIELGRCRSVYVRSAQSLRIHTDGELLCEPDEGVTDVTVEMVPAALSVLRKTPPPRQ